MTEADFEKLLRTLKFRSRMLIKEPSEPNIIGELLQKGYLVTPVPHGVTTDGKRPLLLVDDHYKLTVKGWNMSDKLNDPLERLVAIKKLRDEFEVNG